MKLVLAGLTLALGACSVITTFEDECSADSDCDNSLRCVERLCVRAGSGGMGGMGGSGEDMGSDTVPDPAGLVLTEICNEVVGVPLADALKPETILIGSLMPQTGRLASSGPGREKAIVLAIDEINESGAISPKRFAVVHCDTGTDGEQAVEAANWLVETAKVHAIIGAASSSVTIRVANEVTIPNDVLLISPSSTSPVITNLPDNNLVWRTAPSDTTQGAAIAAHLMASADLRKIAVVSRDDAYGHGLEDAIRENLCGSDRCEDEGQYEYFSRNYRDSDETSMARAALQLGTFGPDVVVLISYVTDGLNFLRLAPDAGLENFILTDGLKDEELFSIVREARTVLENVFGTAPASPEGDLYVQYLNSYTSKWAEDSVTFGAQTYDAMYLIGLAYVAAGIDPMPGGTDLAAAMTRLSAGEPFRVGIDGWNLGLTILQSSEEATLNFEGASGKLDFDMNGEAPADIEGWKLELVPEEKIVSTGVLYTAGGSYVPLEGE